MLVVLFKPSSVFKKLKEEPKWLLAAIIIILSAVLLIVATRQAQIDIALTQLKQNASKMPPGAFQQARKFIESPIMTIIGMVSAVFSTAMVLLVATAFFHLLSSAWGGTANFVKGLSVVAFSWSPLVVKNILVSAVSFFSGKLLAPGLAALLSKKQLVSPLGAFMSGIDLFTFWNLIILVIGLSIVYQVSKSKASILVFSYWLVGVILRVGATVISRGFSAPMG